MMILTIGKKTGHFQRLSYFDVINLRSMSDGAYVLGCPDGHQTPVGGSLKGANIYQEVG